MGSIRSGEPEDPIVAHLHTDIGLEEAKVVAFQHVEHIGKINEFLRIEEDTGTEVHYAWKE